MSIRYRAKFPDVVLVVLESAQARPELSSCQVRMDGFSWLFLS